MENQSKTLREDLHRFFGDEYRRPYRGKGREGGGLGGGGGMGQKIEHAKRGAIFCHMEFTIINS